MCIMSGQPLIKPSDAQKYRSAYLNNLALEAKNNSKNLNANQVYKQTGAPAQLMDTRTTTEKLGDIVKLRVEVMNQLLAITDGQQANQIVQSLADNEVQYVAQNMPYLIKEIKARYAKGITAGVFLPMIRSMINKATALSGIQYGLKNIAGNSLVSNIATILAIAPQEFQYDLLESTFGKNRGITATKMFYDRLPQINSVIQRFPIDIIEAILDAIGLVAEQLIDRNDIDTLMREIRKGGQSADNARRLFLGSAENANLAIGNNIAIIERLIRDGEQILNENLQPQVRPQEEWEGDGIDEPPSRQVEGKSRTSNTAGLDVPEFDYYGTAKERQAMEKEFSAREYVDVSRQGGGAPPEFSSSETEGQLPFFEEVQGMKIAELRNLFTALSPLQKQIIADENPNGWSMKKMAPTLTSSKSQLLYMLSLVLESSGLATETEPEPKKSTYLEEESTESTDPDRIVVREGKIGGMGIHKMRGRGLAKATKKYPPKTDGKVRIEKQPNWTQIGDKLIHTAKLENNILSMRCLSGRNVDGIPTQHISHKLGGVLRKIVGGQLPTYDDIDILTEEEKDKLARIGSISKINSKINIPKKTKEQQEMLEFDILRGQVLAGNDNKGLLKRFKLMLIKFGDEGKLPQREVRDVLMTLASQGL